MKKTILNILFFLVMLFSLNSFRCSKCDKNPKNLSYLVVPNEYKDYFGFGQNENLYIYSNQNSTIYDTLKTSEFRKSVFPFNECEDGYGDTSISFKINSKYFKSLMNDEKYLTISKRSALDGFEVSNRNFEIIYSFTENKYFYERQKQTIVSQKDSMMINNKLFKNILHYNYSYNSNKIFFQLNNGIAGFVVGSDTFKLIKVI